MSVTTDTFPISKHIVRSGGCNKMSKIKNFYSGASILLTGATGPVGKLLISKILIEMEDVAGLYLIIREKKGKSVEERVDHLFNDVIFTTLKQERPDYRQKIYILSGDCSKPALGLNELNVELISKTINVVFHCAESLNMEANLKDSVANNVSSVKSVVHLCKKMKDLKAVIYVSTAYSNCTRYLIEEKLYPPPIEPKLLETIANVLDEEAIKKMTPGLLGKWPNTYTFTKAISENLFVLEGDRLPMGIFRPSIIVPTVADPVPGWTGNLYGPMVVMAAAGVGIMRVMLADVNVKLDIVPADYVVNALICAAWEVEHKRKMNCSEVSIYNCVGGLHGSNYEHPAANPLWATFLIIINNVYWFTFLTFILNNIPVYFIDCYMYMTGRKERMYKIYQKMNKLPFGLKHFSTKEYDIRHENVLELYSKLSEDEQQIFPFERKVNMDQYFADMVLGVKMYIYGETLENAEAEKRYYNKLMILHYITMYVFLGLFVLLFYKLYYALFY